MSEKRYSFRTAAEYLGVTVHTAHVRAKKQGMDTTHGLTAEQIKMIAEAPFKKRSSLKELEAEMEALR